MVPGKAELDFTNAVTVEPAMGIPNRFGPPMAMIASQTGCCNLTFVDNKAVALSMQVTAGKKYMVDFAVYQAQACYVNIDWTVQQTFSGTQHLVIIYEASFNGTAQISVTGDANGFFWWILYSVEVTPLN